MATRSAHNQAGSGGDPPKSTLAQKWNRHLNRKYLTLPNACRERVTGLTRILLTVTTQRHHLEKAMF